MIQCGTYDDYEDPPRVPQITGINSTKKKSEQSESLTEAITGAAVAVKNAFASSTPKPKTAEHTVTICGPSPGKCIDLRLKNLEQLRLLQQLRDDKILSEAEFMEQKKIILDARKKLTC